MSLEQPICFFGPNFVLRFVIRLSCLHVNATTGRIGPRAPALGVLVNRCAEISIFGRAFLRSLKALKQQYLRSFRNARGQLFVIRLRPVIRWLSMGALHAQSVFKNNKKHDVPEGISRLREPVAVFACLHVARDLSHGHGRERHGTVGRLCTAARETCSQLRFMKKPS